jgi:hypothetical protein
MTSGRVEYLQTRLDEARDDLKAELRKDVPRDSVVAAHQTIIKGLQDELKTCSTAGKREYTVLTYTWLRQNFALLMHHLLAPEVQLGHPIQI